MPEVKERFNNPWSDSDDYVFLGHFDYGQMHDDGVWYDLRHDLYAINRRTDSVTFGARFSDEGGDYCSGEVHLSDGKWVMFGGKEIGHAVFEYFANYLPAHRNG